MPELWQLPVNLIIVYTGYKNITYITLKLYEYKFQLKSLTAEQGFKHGMIFAIGV